jgi:hypothetical protein
MNGETSDSVRMGWRIRRSPSGNLVWRGNPLHYLRLYFNCAYYIGIIPFRFVFDETESTYKLQTNRIQKVN